MSSYTTGELAKRAQISVRTLQYYDKRGLLQPSGVTEGGRRQYSDADYDRLQLILLLKGMNLSLKSIAEISQSDQANKVLLLLLDEQLRELRQQQSTTQQTLRQIEQVRHNLFSDVGQPLTSKSDMDQLMTQKKRLRVIHRRLLLIGLPLDVIEIGTLLYGIFRGVWWPFIVGMIIVLAGAAWLSAYYFRSVNYVCPNCDTIFHPSLKQSFFAPHNPWARKLTCPHCHQRNYCVEIAADKDTTTKS